MLEAVHLTFEDGATQSTLTKLPTPTMPPSKVSWCAIHFFYLMMLRLVSILNLRYFEDG